MTATSDNYLSIKKHIKDLALASGRDPAQITLLAVSKGQPWEQIAPIYKAGCREFGESKVQEALEKMAHAPTDIQWHLIGSLQKKKVRKVIGKFVLIHSVDTFELAEKISTCSLESNTTSSILLQVNISGESTKHGLSEEGWMQEVERVKRLPNLNIEGLMTMAPLHEDESTIRKCFSKLREFKDKLNKNYGFDLKHLSMGMTHDYPFAIQEGATIVRVGTALFQP